MGVRVVILLTCIASWSILGCAVKGADGSKRGEAVSESSTPRTFQYVQLNITSLEDGNQARILSNEGSVLIRIKDKWAPAAAERFVHLCREKYYDGIRFIRVSPGYVAQFGIHDDPALTKHWSTNHLPAEVVRKKNSVFTLGFIRDEETSGSQVYINMKDNTELFDPEGLAPFGKVIKGLKVLRSLFPAEAGIKYGKYDHLDVYQATEQGKQYLDNFPSLSIIEACVVLDSKDDYKEMNADDRLEL